VGSLVSLHKLARCCDSEKVYYMMCSTDTWKRFSANVQDGNAADLHTQTSRATAHQQRAESFQSVRHMAIAMHSPLKPLMMFTNQTSPEAFFPALDAGAR
jgi:hypothetical protein